MCVEVELGEEVDVEDREVVAVRCVAIVFVVEVELEERMRRGMRRVWVRGLKVALGLRGW